MHPLVYYIKQALKEIYPDSEASSIAKWLLTQRFGFTNLQLFDDKDRIFSIDEQKELDAILLRLKKNEPLQYILGEEPFYGLTYEVNPSVLIPRPETAELVDWVIQENQEAGMQVLDIGTGSGCIAISLAKYMTDANVTSWDISLEALKIASRNAKRNQVNVLFERQDALNIKEIDQVFDLIISNPPYIPLQERSDMEKNVVDWEPSQALYVPDKDPLLFYRKIAEWGRGILVPKGKLYFEINQRYGCEVIRLLDSYGYQHIELRKDLSGNDRMIKAVR